MGSEMVEVLNDQLIPARTHLQIGALDSIPKQIILNLAKQAYAIGNCQISLMEGKSDEILRELSAHRIDLFVTSFVPT
jgi:LysR family transcriptional activator of nhaA